MDEPTNPFTWSRLNEQERSFTKAGVAATMARRAEVKIEKKREQERKDLAAAGPSAETDIAEHALIDRTNFYSEIVSEAAILKTLSSIRHSEDEGIPAPVQPWPNNPQN